MDTDTDRTREMVCSKVVLALNILNIVVILPHFEKPSIHPRRFGPSLEDAAEGLMVGNYCESGTPKIVMEISTGQHDSEGLFICGGVTGLTWI